MEFKRTKKPRKVYKKTPMNRPCLFDSKTDITQVEKLIREGWSNKKIADFLQIEEITWIEWKKKQPALSKLMDWRAKGDHLVEHSLLEVATGYSHPEEKVFLGPGGSVVTHETRKHYPPSVPAIQFWLTNRRRADWSVQQRMELTGKGGGPIEVHTKPKKITLEDFTEEELALIASAGKKLSPIVAEETEEEEV